MSDIYDYDCLVCGKLVKDYDPKMCCSGFECGCMGMPTEPCACSEECYDKIMSGDYKKEPEELAPFEKESEVNNEQG